ncbi:MAG: HAMP domain-containing histidine kinase [Bacilli bacterium]|nr:HAMP domain-containing histidine kinase [Bacilli bacterium]
MKKKVISLLISIIFIILIFIGLNKLEYNFYRKEFNKKINNIVNEVVDKYPDVNKEDVINILNSDDDNEDILNEYGIYLEKDNILKKNEYYYHMFNILDIIFILIVILLFVIVILNNDLKKSKSIKDITNLIEEINKKNYKLDIDNNSESDLSILKNEIYKTTIMLKSEAENSLNDKKNLKISLEDISHQLKTPLTSILIMLDNILDDPDMDNKVREDFIRDIKREVVNINFLVQNILKLSKMDANAIKFINREFYLLDMVNESIRNISVLSDLKNVKINVNGDKNIKFKCDDKWNVEAITNILKNCLEYSNNDSKIDINMSENNVYVELSIRDYGCGISKKDIKHIFERFYKGSNSSNESVGIGLALAKSIVEKSNGNISVESSKEGSKFILKYYKI